MLALLPALLASVAAAARLTATEQLALTGLHTDRVQNGTACRAGELECATAVSYGETEAKCYNPATHQCMLEVDAPSAGRQVCRTFEKVCVTLDFMGGHRAECYNPATRVCVPTGSRYGESMRVCAMGEEACGNECVPQGGKCCSGSWFQADLNVECCNGVGCTNGCPLWFCGGVQKCPSEAQIDGPLSSGCHGEYNGDGCCDFW